MKTLIVYDTKGNIVFTQSNATSNYKLLVSDIPSGKEIAGVDAVNNKIILRDSTVDKSELEQTKEEVEDLKKQLKATQTALNDLIMDKEGE